MKKILLVGVVLSSIAFAKGNFYNNDSNQGNGMGMGYNTKSMQNLNLTEAQQKELLALRTKHQKAAAPLILNMQEKDLAIRKEMLADKPNWTKIETLTKEKSEIESQMELMMLKNRVEMQEKFGISYSNNCGHGMKKGFHR